MAADMASSEAGPLPSPGADPLGCSPVTGQFNDSLTGDYLWSNVNFGAAVTEVMTPLLLRAAAVVIDVGAPLSHAAIIASELGILAVVGCGDATMRLRKGDRVHVDGGQGTVEILH